MVESFLVESNSLGVRLAHRGYVLTTDRMDEGWVERKVFLYASNIVTQRSIILSRFEWSQPLNQIQEFGGWVVVLESNMRGMCLDLLLRRSVTSASHLITELLVAI